MTSRSTLLLLLFSLSLRADTLILRNGMRITGRWWAFDGSELSFLVNNRLERYQRSEVLEVQFNDDR